VPWLWVVPADAIVLMQGHRNARILIHIVRTPSAAVSIYIVAYPNDADARDPDCLRLGYPVFRTSELSARFPCFFGVETPSYLRVFVSTNSIRARVQHTSNSIMFILQLHSL
jgi:hypothetical protein